MQAPRPTRTPIARPAILAGALIGIGGIAWLVCDSRYVAALLFCIGLYAICTNGLWLFTGKVGYLPVCGEPAPIYTGRLIVTWLGNFIGAGYVGLVASGVIPTTYDRASAIIQTRFAQSGPQTFLLAFLCGIIMLIAVHAYAKHGSVVGILLGIPTFLLCGFEHSIADMFFFATARVLTWRALGHIIIVSLGNAMGSVTACLLMDNELSRRV